MDAFWAGGSGVVVLPCGAGKTLVGAASMARSSTTTLILVTNAVSARQWKEELIRFTSLTEDEIGEYSGSRKEVRPVTIATYQVLTTKRKGVYPHLDLLDAHDWGLIVYDEVHLLPAPIFRMTADLQARRRLGLTATLVREDGREDEVFSLIGPKRYDAPWKDLENQGWIAPAVCTEVRLSLEAGERMTYATAESEDRYRLAATTPAKVAVVDQLLARHAGESALVIGQYVDQLEELAEHLGAPVITGSTTVRERQKLYQAFRDGEVSTLVVSKVANFSIDLPGASVAIQVSGSFGSRQEEAQRLGRIVRPKSDGRQAHFYTVVTRDTVDQEFASHRQRFLAEQGHGRLRPLKGGWFLRKGLKEELQGPEGGAEGAAGRLGCRAALLWASRPPPHCSRSFLATPPRPSLPLGVLRTPTKTSHAAPSPLLRHPFTTSATPPRPSHPRSARYQVADNTKR